MRKILKSEWTRNDRFDGVTVAVITARQQLHQVHKYTERWKNNGKQCALVIWTVLKLLKFIFIFGFNDFSTLFFSAMYFEHVKALGSTTRSQVFVSMQTSYGEREWTNQCFFITQGVWNSNKPTRNPFNQVNDDSVQIRFYSWFLFNRPCTQVMNNIVVVVVALLYKWHCCYMFFFSKLALYTLLDKITESNENGQPDRKKSELFRTLPFALTILCQLICPNRKIWPLWFMNLAKLKMNTMNHIRSDICEMIRRIFIAKKI